MLINRKLNRCALLVLMMTTAAVQCHAQPTVKPFPENRLRDFYRHQAQQQLASDAATPKLLPQFPGLDGGAFGHWGQNPPERSIDSTLGQVDSGTVVCDRINHFKQVTQKGVAIAAGQNPSGPHAVFDPQKLTVVDSWQGEFLNWGSNRFGIMGGASATGQRLVDLSAGAWVLPENTPTRYVGYHRSGENVVFEYRIGEARILDRVWSSDGRLMRSIETHEAIPVDAELKLARFNTISVDESSTIATGRQDGATIAVSIIGASEASSLKVADEVLSLKFDNGKSGAVVHLSFQKTDESQTPNKSASSEVKAVAPGDLLTTRISQWSDKAIATQGEMGAEDAAFAIDTLTIPYADENPFGMPMRLTGIGVMPDGQVAVSTLQGDVWLVSGVNDELSSITWRRYAAGLYQPLGLIVQDGQIVVGGKDQVTRLIDTNNDGEADFYECITNEYPTTGGHDFAADLHQDETGRLYWATASGDFGLTRYEQGGRPQSLGNGLRNSNGIGVSSDGSVTLATIQEGTWCPATAIFEVKNGSFHGHRGPREGHGKYGYDLPLCFVPRGVDNSAGGITFLPEDERLGPLSGHILGTSYGYCSSYVILREVVNGRSQGSVIPLPGEFLSGACRTTFDAETGHIYLAGTEGWQSYAAENGCLHRLRWTNRQLLLPDAVEARQNGLLVRFNDSIDPESITIDNVFCQQWNYLYSGAYGSPEYSVKEPGRQGHDHVPVKSVHLLKDSRSVFIEIPELHPVMQFHLHMQFKSETGIAATPDVYSSIYELGPAFTQFPGYQLIAKRPWADFPIAEKYEQDPRLVEQDSLGTQFGWVSNATKLTLNAVAGLQYEPRRLRIEPGAGVALTFHNTDPSMPHNVVVVKADQVQNFGEQSMVLATNPRAIATHYVPNDPAEICFSPILNPEDQYTVYFEAPAEEGEYRFLCTYPGHWRVMQGSLFVLSADKSLPEPGPSELNRRFVKNWTTNDFAGAMDQLGNHSATAGLQVFRLAGCIKCHKVGNEGIDFGPKLAESAKKYRGESLLKQILEPSAEIKKQFLTWLVVKTDGTVATGLLKRESADSITLLPNPLKPDETLTIPRSEIDEIAPSKQSTMPQGLLMTFSKDEILDLVRFLEGQAAD